MHSCTKTFFFVLISLSLSISCKTKERLIELNTYHNSYQTNNIYFTTNNGVKHKIPVLEEVESHILLGVSFINNDPKKGIDFSTINNNPVKKIKLKAGDVINVKQSFKIGIIDFNNNGIFNEQSVDRFFIAPYQSVTTLIEKTNPWIDTIKQINRFKINSQHYELTSIAHDGNSLYIKELPLSKINEPVKIEAILNIHEAFDLVDLENKPVKSNSLFNNRPLYLEFWFNGCSGCIKSFKYLQTLDTKDFDLVGVNAIDELPVIKSFNLHFGFDFDHYQINENLMKRLGNMGEYPSAIKYDKNGRLVDQFYNFPYKTTE